MNYPHDDDDTWERNPHYAGPPVPHPESDEEEFGVRLKGLYGAVEMLPGTWPTREAAWAAGFKAVVGRPRWWPEIFPVYSDAW